MKLSIVALGTRMPAWVDAGVEDYVRRMPRDWAVEIVELKAAPRGRAVAEILATEAERIFAAVGRATLVALDERGAAWSTDVLARKLGAWHDHADDVAFVIGSADGLAPIVRERAAAVLQLSPFTLPHALVRVVLAEQLYRAWSLCSGHPYHRV
ncbi:MAG: 23S rRNA (pseudouridine(1915)-N(3))-methyltransferase RlmH [Proteobacteria bacterium]|nr:23S rRNA (pseudouridine(1915)-N(3))-methyltransferase RlmH [Pseudomonadota bacterium]